MWRRLQTSDPKTGPRYFAVLDFRARNPDLSSEQAAEALTRLLQPEQPFSSQGIRKLLQRARVKFAQLLIDEVRKTLGDDDPESLENELIDLGLRRWCAPVLDK